MRSVRILHLSDLHLGKHRWYDQLDPQHKILSLYDLDALQALVEVVNDLLNHVDAILISGDILEFSENSS